MADEEESPVQTLARELIELKEKVEWLQTAISESTAALKKDLAGTDRAVVTLNDRISTLERGAEEEDRATISRFVEKLSSMMSGELASATRTARITRDGARLLAERIEKLETGVFGTESPFPRIADLEDRVSAMTPYVELDSRVRALEGHPRRVPDDDFSPPVGALALFTDSPLPKAHAHLMTRAEVEKKSYNDGYRAGQNSMVEAKNEIERKALQAAAQRVQNYLTDPEVWPNGGVANAVISGVVRRITME